VIFIGSIGGLLVYGAGLVVDAYFMPARGPLPIVLYQVAQVNRGNVKMGQSN
jgi:hypothetical protein